MKKSILSLIIGSCFLTGCMSYQSEFQVGDYKLKLPKDAVFSYMEVKVPVTNGTISLLVSNGSFKMNPSVMDAKTAHDKAIIDATGALVLQAVGMIPKP